MELESFMQASVSPNSKRFVVEDSITKVTSDGEPHAMMTMVAGLSGLLAAIIILAVLVSMVACRKHKTKKQQQQQQENNNRILSGAVAMTSVEVSQPQLAGNLNAAFAESTLNLGDDAKDAQQQSTAIIVERY
ncbi:uncharacterized protein LOC133849310 [Drosophila sulfurigaster albostrigata]|uniref:uncharacterized protein LOC133849310 n=1 Tax=Drosophila sulfurigaster albostrigata TaxID=89887 RepID=UPI002D219104|nr:uncharacterized protein LOC133849310 [Drosophila sulfurigaster albostrigata]XP_062141284.1 uncharacterized protein LOC133849310 [Drosophila sulfurigaster albostrigata]XP_062141285.1 uncharacterized protein LOC133849310 [Drosophila sulfurigaster albostrigata]